MSTHHELHFSPETIHLGFFDASLPAVLSADSGDRIQFHWISGEPDDIPPNPSRVLPELRQMLFQCLRVLGPHILTGPVWMNGAKEGTFSSRVFDLAERANRER